MAKSALVHEDKLLTEMGCDFIDIIYGTTILFYDLQKFKMKAVIDATVENFREHLTQELRSRFGDGKDGC